MVSSFAPGRVELLGNHTDYNEGVVLSAAIPLGITATGRRLDAGAIHLQSQQIAPAWRGNLNESTGFQKVWTDYPRGVVWALREAGWKLEGFEGNFDSTLPVGAGLSSSAAIEVATAVLLCRLFHLTPPPMELAKLCRKAENEFVGVQCGLLDQISSLFGKKNHVIFLDCRHETVEQIPFPEDLALLVIHSGVPHALTGGEYNERRASCFDASRLLGISALRDATSAQVLQIADVKIRKRALHITGENERVFQAVQLLRRGDVRRFGTLMTASHYSSKKNFENSTPELDLLVELSLNQPNVYGARLTGGGFGGSIVALLPQQGALETAQNITQEYRCRTGHQAQLLLCKIADGAL